MKWVPGKRYKRQDGQKAEYQGVDRKGEYPIFFHPGKEKEWKRTLVHYWDGGAMGVPEDRPGLEPWRIVEDEQGELTRKERSEQASLQDQIPWEVLGTISTDTALILVLVKKTPAGRILEIKTKFEILYSLD